MSNLLCLNKSLPQVENFIKVCGEELALNIVNRLSQINGGPFDIFSSKEFKDSDDKYGMTETFNQIEEAYKNDRLNRFFNLGDQSNVYTDSELIATGKPNKNAAELRIDQLGEAQALEREGVSMDDIYERTGWRKNNEGQWEDALSEAAKDFQQSEASKREMARLEQEKLEFEGAREVYIDNTWLNSKKVSLTDYNVIKQSVIDYVSNEISSFLYNFDSWAFMNNLDEDTKSYKTLREISKNGDIKKLLSIDTCTFKDLFYNAINLLKSQSDYYGNRSKTYVYDILSDTSREAKAVIALLQSQVKAKINDIYNIRIGDNNSVIPVSLEELNQENDIDIFEANNLVDDNVKEDSEESAEDEASQSEEFDVIGTMLALKDDLNFDRVKNDKQLIIQLFSGIENRSKNDVSAYGTIHYYNPWTIYNQLIKVCHNCKDSDDLKDKLKSLTGYPYIDEILDRINNSNKYATLAWKTLRGQYRIFFDIFTNEKGAYQIYLPNFNANGIFYKHAIIDLVERNKNKTSIFNVGDKSITYNDDYKNKELVPLLNAVKSEYNKIKSTFTLGKNTKAYSEDEKVQFIEKMTNELTKPIQAFNNHSFMDVFKTLVNRLGCTQLGFDITDTELLSVFINFNYNVANNGEEFYTYNPVFDALLSKIEDGINAKDDKAIPNMFDTISLTLDSKNSFILSKDAGAKLKSYFYRGKDGYYSFSHHDKLSRHFNWLSSLTCGEYIRWYDEQCENDNYFKSYHDANEIAFANEISNNLPISNHSVLYRLYVDAKASDESDKLIDNASDIPDYSHLFFALQDDKKLSQLSDYDLIANKLSSFMNQSGDEVLGDERSLYTSYTLSDKSQQVAFVNHRDENALLCLKSLAAKTMMELSRMNNIYSSIVENEKTNEIREANGEDRLELVYEPNFSAKINKTNEGYRIDFNNNGGIRFAYLPQLNSYLYEINNVKSVNEAGEAVFEGSNKYNQTELLFIAKLFNYFYGNNYDKDTAFKEIVELLYSAGGRNNIIRTVLDNEVATLKNKLLSFTPLLERLGFTQNEKTGEWILTNIREKSPFFKKSLDTFLSECVYNSDASLAEQTFIFHNDIVRYGNAKKFSKRANEIIAKGQEIDRTARDEDGNLYDSREGITQGKKVSITWKNVKSKSFIPNKEFYNDIADIIKNEGTAKSRTSQSKNKIDDNAKSIVNANIEAADGQSLISLEYKKRYRGQLGKLTPAEKDIIDSLISLFNKVSDDIEKGNFDENKYKKEINTVYNKAYKTGYFQESGGSIKQFSSTVLNNPQIKRSTATERKNSEYCNEDIKTLIEKKDYFSIRLMAHMNRNGIDCIDDETTVKKGLKKTFNPSIENFFDEFDAIMEDEHNLDLELVNLIPMEDVALVQETPSHALDREDIFGTQITRLLPATVDRSEGSEYNLFSFDKEELPRKISGDELYRKIQSILDLKVQNGIENVKREFGITDEIYDKLLYNKELTQEDITKLNIALSKILRNNSKFSDTDYRFFINPETGEFSYPISEFTSSTELSKTIASVLKREVVANNVNGGQLVQVTNALSEVFYRIKNGESIDSPEIKKMLDKDLQCRIEKYQDGSIKEVYMEAEIPFMYKDAVDEYIDKKTGEIDMNKVPEELKHGIFYRIPTEGLCSIFHIKVKRFTYGLNDHVKLPVEITKLAGLDFDIDKLFTFIAAMKKNKKGILEYVEPDLNNLENNTSKESINNALFELMLSALNSHTGINGYNEFGGYDELKYKGLTITLAIDKAKREGKPIEQCYNELKKLSYKEIENLFSDYNKTQSPCSLLTNINIQSTNFESKDMLAIAANNNALAAELSQLDIKLNTTAFAKGVTIGNSKIINSTSTKFAPKNTVNGTESCQNLIRQPLAAAADVGKDAFLSIIGFNKFSIGVWSGLMNLGCEIEDALLFMQHPIVKYLSDKYKQMDFESEFGIRPLTVLIKNSKLVESTGKTGDDGLFLKPSNEISLSQERLINSLTQSYDGFCKTNPDATHDIEKLLYFLLKNNQETVTLSPFLKIDSKSNISWNSTFGLIATNVNFNQFADQVRFGNTTFTTDILDVFAANGKTTDNTIPRLATLVNKMGDLITCILHTQNPHIYERLYKIVDQIVNLTGSHIDETAVKDIYNLYNYALLTVRTNYLYEYFSGINLKKREDILNNIVSSKEILLNRYPDNYFIKNVQIDRIADSTVKKYKTQLKDINSQKVLIDPVYLSESTEEMVRTDLIKLLLSNDQEAIKFANDVFILGIMQSGFNKFSSKNPLRYYNEAALSKILDGNYMKYFTDKIYDSEKVNTKFSLNDILSMDNSGLSSDKLYEYIIRTLPNLIQYKNKIQYGLQYYKDRSGAISVPVSFGASGGVYRNTTKLGISGVLLESFEKLLYNISDVSEFNENNKETDNKINYTIPQNTLQNLDTYPHTRSNEFVEQC